MIQRNSVGEAQFHAPDDAHVQAVLASGPRKSYIVECLELGRTIAIAAQAFVRMKITIAKHAGYCWGVKRSYKKLLEAVADTSKTGPFVTFGPLIHNPQTVDDLRNRYGIDYTESVDAVTGGRVAIRTHGVKPEVIDSLKKRGAEVIDLTCPLVKVIHRKAEKLHKAGYHVVIVGSPTHPEVISITGYAPNNSTVVETAEDIVKIPKGKPIGVVVQSTNMIEKVEKIVHKIEETHGTVKFQNTICFVTTERQEETQILAKECDAILVVGGKTSSNTEKLAKTATYYGAKTVVKIEYSHELDVAQFVGRKHIGVLAGASTPGWLIQEVVTKLTNEVGEQVEIVDLSASAEKVAQDDALDDEFETVNDAKLDRATLAAPVITTAAMAKGPAGDSCCGQAGGCEKN